MASWIPAAENAFTSRPIKRFDRDLPSGFQTAIHSIPRFAPESRKQHSVVVRIPILFLLAAAIGAAQPATPPGVVIDHSPQSSGKYIGSPSIAVLRDGRYVATHDFFGPNAGHERRATTRVFRSSDKGAHWTHIADISGMFWATLFEHRGALYLIGTDRQNGNTIIRRSSDAGLTWTEPYDQNSGLLLRGEYHCAPQPVVIHKGRIWRAMEDTAAGGGWGKHFRAFMMSVPVDADLLRAGDWTFGNPVARDAAWLDGKFGGWLEGNAVVTPKKDIVDILRVDYAPGGKAAVIDIFGDTNRAKFDPAAGFIDLPGGAKKFTIRYDSRSRRYWSLTNWVPPKHQGPNAASVRNTLALISSPDLRKWEIRSIVLYHPDSEKHAFQYVDWLFEGNDMIFVSRTAYDDDEGGAHNAHDANFMTFHRLRNFRKLAMRDSVVDPASLGALREVGRTPGSAADALVGPEVIH